jgi:hypothetical protein
MRIMTDKQSDNLRELLRIANGDSALVNKAIREAARGRRAAPVEDVVKYILKHRQPERLRA